MIHQNLKGYSLGCPPSQDASHHQDDITFLVGGSRPKPSFATGMLGVGTTQDIPNMFPKLLPINHHQPPPANSIRVFLIPDRWRSPFQPLSSGHVFH